VGVVNALEVLHAFPGDEGLAAFRDWLTSVDAADLAGKGKRAPSKAALAAMTPAERFKATHRGARASWGVSEGFPSRAVLAAYRHPTVTSDPAALAFAWRQPDAGGLRAVCAAKFGWPPAKADEQLGPVLRSLASGAVQTTLESYMHSYDDNVTFAKIRSKRLAAAVSGMATGGAATAAELALPEALAEDGGGNGGGGGGGSAARKRVGRAAAGAAESSSGGAKGKRRGGGGAAAAAAAGAPSAGRGRKRRSTASRGAAEAASPAPPAAAASADGGSASDSDGVHVLSDDEVDVGPAGAAAGTADAVLDVTGDGE
jgi:DNA excision repair protein ERCC-5